MAWAAAVSAFPAEAQDVDDPRIELSALRLAGAREEALERVERLLADDPERAYRLGLGVLRGDLLDHMGREGEAAMAFVSAMGQSPPLASYSRYRAAGQQALLGHPEVAAGLVATAVAERGLDALVPGAAQLLRDTVLAGGDCRLLADLGSDRLERGEVRIVELTRADCALRDGERDRALSLYLALIEQSVEDEIARQAAERVADLAGERPAPEVARLLGRAFHQHREFDRAIHYLGPVVAAFAGPLAGERYELAYMLVRSRFWQERYAQAAAGYSALAARARVPPLVAQALYQQGRCHELIGEWPEATATFRRAFRTDPRGRFADAALIGAMRIEWRNGQEERALELFELLAGRLQWRTTAARAAIFLAASDVVVGRADRAGAWLDLASRGDDTAQEVDYWRGRRAELTGDAEEAVRRYLVVMRRSLYHPLAQEAQVRLQRPELAPAARAAADRRGTSLDDLYDKWLLLVAAPAERAEVAGQLARQLARDGQAAPFMILTPVPIADWPLWRGSITRPDERLLALGLWSEAGSAVGRHFPYDPPALAFTAAARLVADGAVRRGVAVAETLTRRVPARLADPFLPHGLRRLLYPFAWFELVDEQATRRGIDPHLLIAIIREESRFEPRALSGASARGLTQFVQPTAVEVAAAIGLEPLTADDLYRPQVAIALGAAYVAELVEGFTGADYMAVAAYNAGPPAARLWRSYCYSGEVAEYYSKVSYGETRNYLRKVLGSWMQYRDIYGAPPRVDRWAAGLVAEPAAEPAP
ncbi:MAG TPA: lytic transglycosylase domain-containing protein [Thermoanaerobaculia bacterium]|nr:lytic transglycosylase domain-containing protein [Thermoanaerobaculia bacterium]